jgi:anti-anti-sigma regulatory factor
MLEIQPVMNPRDSADSGTATLILIGRIRAEHVAQLQKLVRAEHPHPVMLDLTEVNLVDLEVVRFLVHCEHRASASRAALRIFGNGWSARARH